MTVIDEVAAERRRQVEVEGWSLEHDDEHTDYSLAKAAAAYTLAAAADNAERSVMDDFGNKGLTWQLEREWPKSWNFRWFKPKDRRRDLIKAAALIVAEIERMDRCKVK